MKTYDIYRGMYMAFERNREELSRVISENAVIRHVSKHRNTDGTPDTAGNMKIWNDAVARFDQIPLWEHGTPGFDNRDPLQIEPSIVFVPAPEGPRRGTVIVAHGGGFAWRTGCEGFNVAAYFNDAGFAVAVLTYRLVPFTRRDAMADMQRAIRILRLRKTELGITDMVAVMGFSAGGMLSGNCATHFDFLASLMPRTPSNGSPAGLTPVLSGTVPSPLRRSRVPSARSQCRRRRWRRSSICLWSAI